MKTVVALAFIALSITACGVKGDPYLPMVAKSPPDSIEKKPAAQNPSQKPVDKPASLH